MPSTQSDGAQTTVVDSCYLRGQFDGRIYRLQKSSGRPGGVDVVAGTLDVSTQPYKVCMTSHAVFSGPTGDIVSNAHVWSLS